MSKQELKEIAFNDVYASLNNAEIDDLSIDGLTPKETKDYLEYFEKYKNKALKYLDGLKH